MRPTQVYLAANPSHLEAVDPVLEGIVRAKQDRLDLAGEAFTVLPLLMHGDAAFAGQGVVAETLNLSQLRGYRTGGTIHVVVNNQVGFTTSPSSSRSSFYSTDVARMVQAPIFHVNGDDPEACVRVAELAFDFRQEFNKDVVIDLVCYRRRGHNEGDDPSMTQPLMYNLIEAKRSVRKLYTEALTGRGDITVEESEAALKDYQAQLERAFTETQAAAKAPIETAVDDVTIGKGGLERPAAQVRDLSEPPREVHTAVPVEVLHRIGDAFAEPARGLHGPPEDPAAARPPQGHDPRRRHRLGDGRAAGLRIPSAGAGSGPPGRPGQPAGHVRPAARRTDRQGDGGGVDAAALPRPTTRPGSGSTTRC